MREFGTVPQVGEKMRLSLVYMVVLLVHASSSLAEDLPVSKLRIGACFENMRSPDPGVRKKAAYALRFLDGDAQRVASELVRAVRDTDPAVAASAIESITALNLPIRDDLLLAFVDASAADNSALRMTALTALSEIGERGVAALTQALAHHDPATRERAALRLGILGARARAAVPALVLAIRDNDPKTGIAAIQALGTAGRALPSEAVPALIKALENARQYRHAVRSLGQIGEAAQSAVGALVRAEDVLGWQEADGKETVRCLAKLNAPPVVALCKSLLRDADIEAAHLLAELAASSRPQPAALVSAFPVLTTALDDERLTIRTLCAIVLSRRRPLDKRVVPVLTQAVDSTAADAMPMLAVETLGDLGSLAEPAIETLIAELRSERIGLHAKAALALGRIGAPKPNVLSALAVALGSKEASVQAAAADAIGLIGPAARTAIPALAQLLRSPRLATAGVDVPDPRVNAVRALGLLGRDAASEVGLLIEVMSYTDAKLARAAIDALAIIGPGETASVLPKLLRIAAGNPSQKHHIAMAMACFGKEGREAARRIADETDNFLARAMVLSRLGLPSSEARAFTRMGLRSIEFELFLEDEKAVVDSIHYVSQFGRNASEAIPTLENLLHRSDAGISGAAKAAVDLLSAEVERVPSP